MNNLKEYYDRIVHTVAILVLLSFGIHYDTARMIMEVLQLAEHRIKTGYGVSQHLYGGKKGGSVPEMGLGQGNGNAPTIWCLISSKMMEAMKKRGHGVNLRSFLLLTLTGIVCFAFVDNTDLPMSAPTRNTTGEELQPLFQAKLDHAVSGHENALNNSSKR